MNAKQNIFLIEFHLQERGNIKTRRPAYSTHNESKLMEFAVYNNNDVKVTI